MKKRLLAFFAVIMLVSVWAITAHAADVQWKPQLSIPGTNIQAGEPISIGPSSVGEYLRGMYIFAIYAGSIVAAIVLMVGGFLWLSAGGNATQISSAKTFIGGALSGFVLLLLSWTLLNTVNPALTTFKPLVIQQVPHKDLPPAQIQPVQSCCVCRGPAGFISSGGLVCRTLTSSPDANAGICICNGDASSATSSPSAAVCQQNADCVFQSSQLSTGSDAAACAGAAGVDSTYTCTVQSGACSNDIECAVTSQNKEHNTPCTADNECGSGLSCNMGFSCLITDAATAKSTGGGSGQGCCVEQQGKGSNCTKPADCQSGLSCVFSYFGYVSGIGTCK